MSNVLNGGAKFHKQGRGVSKTACGKRYTGIGLYDEEQFKSWADRFPTEACLKCQKTPTTHNLGDLDARLGHGFNH